MTGGNAPKGIVLRTFVWLLLGLIGLGIHFSHRAANPGGWKEIAPGLAYRRLRGAATEIGDSAWLHVIRLDPERYRLRLLDAGGGETASVRQIAVRHCALAVINGGFFDEGFRPLGLRVSAGRRLHPIRRADWGVFLIRNGRPAIVHTRDYHPDGVMEALQCGPRLLVDGKIVRLKKQAARRACIALDGRGRVYLVVSEGTDMDATCLARTLRAPESQGGLACRDALNLDGGPSAQLFVEHAGFRLDLPGTWGVPDALGVFPAGAG